MRTKSRSWLAASKAALQARGCRARMRQLREIAARLEHEHAAVPVVIAGCDELRARSERRLFDELRPSGRRGRRPRRGGCSHSRSPAHARRCRRSRACRPARARRPRPPPLEGARSRITWSAGATTRIASGSVPGACSAASAIAGRGVAADGLEQDRRPRASTRARSCSATRKRCASLHTTIGAAPAMPARRSAVSCSMVCLPVSASSCFGYSSRDSGHRRVPAPPDRITGINVMFMAHSEPLAAADRIIAEAVPRHMRRVVEIAPVEYHGRLSALLHAVEIRAAELPPFGDDGQRVRALERLRARSCTASGRRGRRRSAAHSGMRHRDRRRAPGARRPQRLHQHPAGRLAHVVGVRLEGQPPQRDGLARESPKCALILLNSMVFCRLFTPPPRRAGSPGSPPRPPSASAPARPWGSTSRRSRRRDR